MTSVKRGPERRATTPHDRTRRARDVGEVADDSNIPPLGAGAVEGGGSGPYYSLNALDGLAAGGGGEDIVVDRGAMVTVLPR